MDNTEKKTKIKSKMCGLRWSPETIAWLGYHKNIIEFCAQNNIVMDFEKFSNGALTQAQPFEPRTGLG